MTVQDCHRLTGMMGGMLEITLAKVLERVGDALDAVVDVLGRFGRPINWLSWKIFKAEIELRTRNDYWG